MKIDYDPQADAIYIQLRNGDVDDTLSASKYVFVDVDKEGIPLGMEILFASRILDSQEMTSFTVNTAQFTDMPRSPLPTS